MLTLPLVMLFFLLQTILSDVKKLYKFSFGYYFPLFNFYSQCLYFYSYCIFYDLKVVFCKEHIAEFGYKVKKLCSIGTLNQYIYYLNWWLIFTILFYAFIYLHYCVFFLLLSFHSFIWIEHRIFLILFFPLLSRKL